MSEYWMYGLIGLLLGLHIVALVRAYRRSTKTAANPPDEAVTPQGIECTNCGVVNGDGYRYCRQCVSELPGQPSTLDGVSGPERRQTL